MNSIRKLTGIFAFALVFSSLAMANDSLIDQRLHYHDTRNLKQGQVQQYQSHERSAPGLIDRLAYDREMKNSGQAVKENLVNSIQGGTAVSQGSSNVGSSSAYGYAPSQSRTSLIDELNNYHNRRNFRG